jgi:hypothetical protein
MSDRNYTSPQLSDFLHVKLHVVSGGSALIILAIVSVYIQVRSFQGIRGLHIASVEEIHGGCFRLSSP